MLQSWHRCIGSRVGVACRVRRNSSSAMLAGASLGRQMIIEASPCDLLWVWKSARGYLVGFKEPMTSADFMSVSRIDKEKFLVVLGRRRSTRRVLSFTNRPPIDVQFMRVVPFPEPFVPENAAKMPDANPDLRECIIGLEGRRHA
jgi:hypothetical protein